MSTTRKPRAKKTQGREFPFLIRREETRTVKDERDPAMEREETTRVIIRSKIFLSNDEIRNLRYIREGVDFVSNKPNPATCYTLIQNDLQEIELAIPYEEMLEIYKSFIV